MSKIKFTTQRNIVCFSVAILLAKVIAYFVTNSVGILTDALESIVNVVTGFVSLYALSVALKPVDKDHPFGHGKVESLSASLEGILILMAGLIIVFEAIKRLFSPADIQQLDIGIIIVGVAGLMNYVLGYYSIKIGKKHNSIALVAGGKHLQSDTYSTIGLVIGLILLMITKLAWLDSLIAMCFGCIIIYTGYKILKETTSNLMDTADFESLDKLKDIIKNTPVNSNCISVDNIKIVKYGNSHHIDCDITVPFWLTVEEAHKEIDNLELLIQNNYDTEVDFTIHSDGCKPEQCIKCNQPNKEKCKR